MVRANTFSPNRQVMRLNLHGHTVEIAARLPGLRQVIHDLLASLAVDAVPEGFHPVEGLIEPYDADVVARHISPNADCVARFGDGAELWREAERNWLIDDNWGLCEINLLKRTWRSWVLPIAESEPMRCLDRAVLWPLACVLAPRGLVMIPAPSIVHRGRGVLLLAPFNLEPELSLLAHAGHGVVSSRWTAIREEAGRSLLLQVPGKVERSPVPHLRMRLAVDFEHQPCVGQWYDLCPPDQMMHYADCSIVLLVEPGRRAMASLKPLTGASAQAAVRHAWPMPEFSQSSRPTRTALQLAQQSAIFRIELSRDPRALLRLLDQINTEPLPTPAKSTLRPSLTPQPSATPRPLRPTAS